MPNFIEKGIRKSRKMCPRCGFIGIGKTIGSTVPYCPKCEVVINVLGGEKTLYIGMINKPKKHLPQG